MDARRPRRRRPRTTRRERVTGLLVDWWHRALLGTLAVVVLVSGVPDLPVTLAAARGAGVPGTFTAVEDLGCPRATGEGGCSFSGTFVSDDGTVRLDDVSLFEQDPGAVGGTARALHVPGSRTGVVYRAEGDTTYALNLAFVVASAGYLVHVAAQVARARARARRDAS